MTIMTHEPTKTIVIGERSINVSESSREVRLLIQEYDNACQTIIDLEEQLFVFKTIAGSLQQSVLTQINSELSEVQEEPQNSQQGE